MADLELSSFRQGPLGEAIQTADDLGLLPPPTFAPAATLTGNVAGATPSAPTATVTGPAMQLLGPGHVEGLAGGTVLRTDPPDGAVDVEPNYMAVAEVVPPELPWVLTPAKAAGGKLRPWLVLVVVEAATTPLQPGRPCPTIEADVGELPDLRDSWAWAHIQRTTGTGTLPGGAQASAAAVARLVCPRRLSENVTYRACLVPAFLSGRAAGLGQTGAAQVPHDLAWKVDQGGRVLLPVYAQWTFTTGLRGDFEDLVRRLEPADPEALRVASVRPVDVRAPWVGDTPLAAVPQRVGVQGALVPFDAPPSVEPPADPAVLAELDRRLRAQLDAPARHVEQAPGDDTSGSLAPPLYGGRHVVQQLVEPPAGQPWVTQLNTAVAHRVAAGLGADYVRDNQEDLMARAWAQVGAIREANRLRAVVELTSEVATKVHQRHVAPLMPGEVVALAAPASARTRTSGATTLAMETRMSRLVDGAATSAFARQLRPAGPVARRTGVTVRGLIPRALVGEVSVPAGAPVIPRTPQVVAGGLTDVTSEAAATQLVTMTALVQVAAVNQVASLDASGTDTLVERLDSLALGDELQASIAAGSVSAVATAIADQVETVSQVTGQVLTDMAATPEMFGDVSVFGVPVPDGALAGRVSEALQPGTSHLDRLATQVSLPTGDGTPARTPSDPRAPVMACPDFPVPTALALLARDPEWFVPGLGALPANKVALLRQNAAFVESYLVGINHEMMRELLWREYSTDQRGTPFTRFWPRPDGQPDIPPVATWVDGASLGSRLAHSDSLSVLLVRGDVVRRYPGMVVTAVRSTLPDAAGQLLPDTAATPEAPRFVVKVDDSTVAYAFEIAQAELTAPADEATPGWFFVFAENGYRIRFGFDDPPAPNEVIQFASWNDATWPTDDGTTHPAFVPVARGHAVAGVTFGPPPDPGVDPALWGRDAADVARITLQRPFRVAIHANVLLRPGGA